MGIYQGDLDQAETTHQLLHYITLHEQPVIYKVQLPCTGTW